jgi:DNA repair exonuclease SbcCD nuclease subunit
MNRGGGSLSRTDVTLVHTSDLHISGHSDLKSCLDPVLETAMRFDADAVLLVGDIFDNNRVAADVLRAARDRMESVLMPVVVLPGNHDALGEGSCYDRGFRGSPSVSVLGMTSNTVQVAAGAVQVWGVPHIGESTDYPVTDPPVRVSRWQIALLHGHYTDAVEERYAWPIRARDLQRTRADYVAMGHWDHRVQVATSPPAWYSGAPHHAGAVTVVRLSKSQGVQVCAVRLASGTALSAPDCPNLPEEH